MKVVLKYISVISLIVGLGGGIFKAGQLWQEKISYNRQCKALEKENVKLQKELINTLDEYRTSLAYVLGKGTGEGD